MVEVVYNYRLQQKNKQQYNGSKEPMVRCSKGAPLGQIANTGLDTVRTITIHTFFIYSAACLPGALLSFKPDKLRRTGLAIITNVSKRTLYRLIKNEEFPKVKIGRRLLFNKERVINHIENKYGKSW